MSKMKLMSAFARAAGLPDLDDMDGWESVAKYWRDRNSDASEWKDKYERSQRELEAITRANKAWSDVFDKLSLTVPSVEVQRALKDIVDRCDKHLPQHEGSMLSGRLSPDEVKWHPILRAIRNDAWQAREAIAKGLRKE